MYICRICLQKIKYEYINQIDLNKLRTFTAKFPILPELEELYQNHIICSVCIDNFRTLQMVFRQAEYSNKIIITEKNLKNLQYVHLRDLKKFAHLQGNFIICRLCLEPTTKIAIHLYDSSTNILPMECIKKIMQKMKFYININLTIKPILCENCWENIKITYSFIKEIKIVGEKIWCYQTLTKRTYIDREQLRNVLNMWNELDVSKVKNGNMAPSKNNPVNIINSYIVNHKSIVKNMPNLISANKDFKKKITSANKGFKKAKKKKKLIEDSSVQDNTVVKRITRLSRKLEYMDQLDPEKLLILQKEEVVTEKRPSVKLKKPKIAKKKKENQNNINLIQMHNNKFSKLNSNVYCGKKTSISNTINNNKEATQVYKEMQIKKEMLDECADEFSEMVYHNENINQDKVQDDQCPNLQCFIKIEPVDYNLEMSDIEMDDPPMLEFEGPCLPVSTAIPNLTIQNTFTLDDKQQLMNTINDKLDGTEGNDSIDKNRSNSNCDNLQNSFDDITKKSTGDLSIPALQGKLNTNRHKSVSEKYQVNIPIQKSLVLPLKRVLNKDQNESKNFQRRKSVDSQLPLLSKIHSSENFLECIFCDYKTAKIELMNRHHTLHINNTLKLYPCPKCTFNTTNKYRCVQHVRKHHPGINYIFQKETSSKV